MLNETFLYFSNIVYITQTLLAFLLKYIIFYVEYNKACV